MATKKTVSKTPALKNGKSSKKALEVLIEGNMLVIHIPLAPYDSASGKSLVLASTRGNVATDCEYDGSPVILGLSAYVKK